MTLGERLLSLRAEHGWKQRDLVARTGLRQSMVSNLEHGNQKTFQEAVLAKLAAAFGMSVEELLEGVSMPAKSGQRIVESGQHDPKRATSHSALSTAPGDTELYAAYQAEQSPESRVSGPQSADAARGTQDAGIHASGSDELRPSASESGRQQGERAAEKTVESGQGIVDSSAIHSPLSTKHSSVPLPGQAAGSQATSLEPATVQVVRTRSHHPDEQGQPGQVIEEHLSVHQFVTTPAKVGMQRSISLEVMDGEWQGLRIYIERPCYVEEIEATKEALMKELDRTAQRLKRALLDEIAGPYRTAQPDLSRVAS